MSKVERKFPYVYLTIGGETYYFDDRKPPLGAGSMGTVYMGYSCKSGMRVAIKCVNSRFANNPKIRARAKLEAALMFRHQNLIEMLGCCEEHPNRGAIYIISKFVPGMNIDQFISSQMSMQTPDRVKRICTMFYPVLDALSYIHSHNIVHMDIKPSNIMVENGSNVRLMDLGISYVALGESYAECAELMGTPKYAAPEQFDVNESSHLNAQTDIYEAGVTLYELLTGYNPYVSSDIHQSVEKHRTTILPYVQNVPNRLVDVLRKATAPEQYNRYCTALQFKNAISEALLPRHHSDSGRIIAIVLSSLVLIASIIIIILKCIYDE